MVSKFLGKLAVICESYIKNKFLLFQLLGWSGYLLAPAEMPLLLGSRKRLLSCQVADKLICGNDTSFSASILKTYA